MAADSGLRAGYKIGMIFYAVPTTEKNPQITAEMLIESFRIIKQKDGILKQYLN